MNMSHFTMAGLLNQANQQALSSQTTLGKDISNNEEDMLDTPVYHNDNGNNQFPTNYRKTNDMSGPSVAPLKQSEGAGEAMTGDDAMMDTPRPAMATTPVYMQMDTD